MGRAPLMELSAAWLFCEVVLAAEDSRGNGARLPLPNSRSTARGVTVRTRPPEGTPFVIPGDLYPAHGPTPMRVLAGLSDTDGPHARLLASGVHLRPAECCRRR